MAEERFDAPKRVAINRVYTRKGDGGSTALVGGQRVPKHDLRICAYGTVDELNATVGAARVSALAGGPEAPKLMKLGEILIRIQHELFNLGSVLATLPEDLGERQPRVTERDISRLEAEMDEFNEELEPLRSFVLPGGSRLEAELHICRTVCRRAEREVAALVEGTDGHNDALSYLNRLSDAFFVFGRWTLLTTGHSEVLWNPNQHSD